MALDLVTLAILVTAASGLPGFFFFRRSSATGQKIAVALMLTGTALGLTGACIGLLSGAFTEATFLWPAVGDSLIGLDALGAFFLVPVLLVGGLGSIFGLGYWPQPRHPRNGSKLRIFWGLLVAGMTLLLVSRHALVFLLAWELMALSAFFLITTEDNRRQSRQAGLVYLMATHVSTLILFGLFTLWHQITGSYAFLPLAEGAVDTGTLHALFFLALAGFGIKAGIMPFHFWLPGAHATAPCHVSAMLSGIVLKMGIYGLIRFLSLLPVPPPLWGGVLLTLGCASSILGVAFALAQHDLKRLLAYHSVENIGIILMGLGLALLGHSSGQPLWIVLGMAGCLLHIWNHALFKSLLFFGAGSVIHGAQSRQLDSLGGLGKRMPWTAALFLVGAVAIAGLPPLNGFISELLVYLGLFKTVTTPGLAGNAAVIAAPALAMTGALAVACFVKVYGTVFSGNPRTAAAARAHESPWSMRLPMLVLALFCLFIGLASPLVAPILDRVIGGIFPGALPSGQYLAAIVPLDALSVFGGALLAVCVLFATLLIRRGRSAPRVPTWDCGYDRPDARMQYTAASFARMLTAMFGWILRPHVHRPRLDTVFPGRQRLESHVDEVVLDRILMPAMNRTKRGGAWFHRFQQGLTQHYLLYILIVVIVMLGTLIPFDAIVTRLFAR